MRPPRHNQAARGGTAARVELWLLDRDAIATRLAAIETATPRLSADEIDRAATMADRQRARRWAAGRTAVRMLLEAHCGEAIRQQPFARTPAGRPTIADSLIDFSVTDSGPFLLIAVAVEGRIGVDIEQPREFRMSPERIDLIVAAGEGLAITAATPLQSWTRIEAFAKATSPSLAATLARLGIQGHGLGHLTAHQVYVRARQARADSAVEIHDLELPRDLSGAFVGPQSPPGVHFLDIAAIERLAR